MQDVESTRYVNGEDGMDLIDGERLDALRTSRGEVKSTLSYGEEKHPQER